MNLDLEQLNIVIDALRFYKDKGIQELIDQTIDRIDNSAIENDIDFEIPETIQKQFLEQYSNSVDKILELVLSERQKVLNK